MRNKQIDILRAWGIIWVVAGHAGSPFFDYIYTFHMPLFFFISGFLRYQDETVKWTVFLKRKWKSSIFPYLFFWFFNMVLYRQLFFLFTVHKFAPNLGLNEIKGLFLGGFWLSDYSNCVQLWYLQLFFIACIIFEAVVRYFIGGWKAAFFLLLMLVTVPFQTMIPDRSTVNVFNIKVLPAALVFMMIGYFFHDMQQKFENHFSKNANTATLRGGIGAVVGYWL